MLLNESFLNSDCFYFHGSSNQIDQISPPSPYKPFFVTPDVRFAFQYSKAGQENDRTTFNVNNLNCNSKVYLISLNFNNANILDCSKDKEIYKLAKYYPKYILDNFLCKEYSVWSIFKYLNNHLFLIYKKYKSVTRYMNYLESINYVDHFGNHELKIGLCELIRKYHKLYSEIYLDNDDPTNCLYDLIALFNLQVQNMGYNGFANVERIEINPGQFLYGTSIGIFDKLVLASIYPESFSYNKINKTLKIMDEYISTHPNIKFETKTNMFFSIYKLLKNVN